MCADRTRWTAHTTNSLHLGFFPLHVYHLSSLSTVILPSKLINLLQKANSIQNKLRGLVKLKKEKTILALTCVLWSFSNRLSVTYFKMCMQAAVTHQGYGYITPPAWGGTMQGSWSWALFTLQSWLSHPNNKPSTSAATAPPSVPRLYVYKISITYIIYGSESPLCTTYFKFFVSWIGLWPKRKVSSSVCFLDPGFASRRNLYICIPAAHPPGRAWGEDSFGEGKQRAGGGTGGPALQYTLPGEGFSLPTGAQFSVSRLL